MATRKNLNIEILQYFKTHFLEVNLCLQWNDDYFPHHCFFPHLDRLALSSFLLRKFCEYKESFLKQDAKQTNIFNIFQNAMFTECHLKF